jgi:cysteine-rich repeat protein
MKLILNFLVSTFFLELLQCQICSDHPTCGDGIVQTELGEECDDGNTSISGCVNCRIGCGYSCRNAWGPICNTSDSDYRNFSLHNSVCLATAGDGKRVASEECDDGNLESGDGCTCSLTGKVCRGSCTVEDRWTCSGSVDLLSSCSSKLLLADRCSCAGKSVNITTCGENISSSVDGFSGASSTIQCQSCAKNHYGNCVGPKTFCLWNETCSSQGFCSGDGKCICFGNFSGPKCNRCKRDHYGPTCGTYCNSLTTCRGHGTCDINGSCAWNAFCEGALSVPDTMGNGRRLGTEECDDGNLLDGDGCSRSGKVEVGFICLGGCQPNGDVRRRFGECQADVCSPVPCEWALMDTPAGEGSVLFVITPRLAVRMGQTNPFPGKQNTLTVSLAPNIPMPSCVPVTKIVFVQITPVLQQEQSQTICQSVVLTISSMIGAQLPSSNTLIPLGNTGKAVFSGVAGRWNDANKSLILTVQREIKKNESIVFSFTVVNADLNQPSPDIVASTEGIVIAPALVDKDRTSTPPTPGTVPGDAEPLKIRKFSGSRSMSEEESLAVMAPWRRLLPGSSSVLNGSVGSSTSDLGAANVITVSLLLVASVPSGARITLAGLLPSLNLLLFARTSSTQCVQSLPYGADAVGNKSAYVSTSFKNVRHAAFLQRLYDNNTLVFEIFWSFSTVRSLQERFQYARSSGEGVVWFIRSPKGTDLIKVGTWLFSRRMASSGDPFDIGSGSGFSFDDGAWGAATGVVDGSIETSANNPAISCTPGQTVCNADFWGQGNFNQQQDTGCATSTCCDTYYTGTGVPNSTRSNFIRNELYLLPCTTCSCMSAGSCNLSTWSQKMLNSSSLDSCTSNQTQGWIQGFDRTLVYNVDSPLSINTPYSFSFVLRNPFSAQPSPVAVSISIGNTKSWTNLTAPRPLAVNPPSVTQSGIGQSTAFPGAQNIISVTLAVNFLMVPLTTVTLRGLLSKTTFFLSLSPLVCSGLFVNGTNSAVHSSFRQELYDGNVLQFTVIWAFGSSKTLTSRIQSAASSGEAVQWRILRNGAEYLYSGVWKLSAGPNIVTPFIWGASRGTYAGDPAASNFWGQDSRLGCDQYYVDGVGKMSSSIRHEISMVESTFLYAMPSSSFDIQASSTGDIVLTALTTVEPSSIQVAQLVVQNQIAARMPANVSMFITGCNRIDNFRLLSNSSLTPDTFGAIAGDSEPLLVRTPEFITARMGQSSPFPTALNEITMTLTMNILLDSNANATIRLFNLLGASAASGELPLTSLDGKSHLYFASSPTSRPGFGLWDDTSKSLSLFVSVSIPASSRLILSFVLENPPYAQRAPNVTVVAQSGVLFSALVTKDLGTVGIIDIPGSVSALYVICPYFLSAKIGQSSPFPSDLNTITVVWSTNFAIRPMSRAYSQFVLLINGLQNASAMSGAMPLYSSCESCFIASWNDSFKALSIQILSDLDPTAEYVVSFNITNPPRGQIPPSTAISAISMMVASDALCNGFNARNMTTLSNSIPPLGIDTAQFTLRRIGQSNPYPGAINILTITISTNVPLFVSSRTVNSTVLSIAGLQGAFFDSSTSLIARTDRPSDSFSNLSSPFSARWNIGIGGRSSGITLIVVRQTQQDVNYTLSFNVTNQLQGQSSPTISINCVGIFIDWVQMDPDNSTIPPGLPATVLGDATPLKIYNPSFRLKNIGQSLPYPGVVNTIFITLSFNADLRQSCLLYASWRIMISNMIGGPATNG